MILQLMLPPEWSMRPFAVLYLKRQQKRFVRDLKKALNGLLPVHTPHPKRNARGFAPGIPPLSWSHTEWVRRYSSQMPQPFLFKWTPSPVSSGRRQPSSPVTAEATST